jgi:hypothetical protein
MTDRETKDYEEKSSEGQYTKRKGNSEHRYKEKHLWEEMAE